MAEKKYVLDQTFKGKFRPGDLVNEVGTNRVFIFEEKDSSKYDFSTLFRKVVEKK